VLHPNGGTIAPDKNITKYYEGKGATLPKAKDMSKTHYEFAGWYDNASLNGNAIQYIERSEKGKREYWAKWIPVKYDVVLHPNGGVIQAGKNVTQYTYGETTYLPKIEDITYPGYYFEGWYDNRELRGSPVYLINNTQYGTKEYWAKWKRINITMENDTIYVYAIDKRDDIQKISENIEFRFEHSTMGRMQAFLTQDPSYRSKKLSRVKYFNAYEDVAFALPYDVVKDVVETKADKQVYLQVLYNGVWINRRVNIRLCVAFEQG
jgi:hypothetical protein